MTLQCPCRQYQKLLNLCMSAWAMMGPFPMISGVIVKSERSFSLNQDLKPALFFTNYCLVLFFFKLNLTLIMVNISKELVQYSLEVAATCIVVINS